VSRVGIRFVSLDAHKKAVNFYKKLGFNIYDNKKRNIPMYFDLKKIEERK